jgi:hypothetical protein
LASILGKIDKKAEPSTLVNIAFLFSFKIANISLVDFFSLDKAQVKARLGGVQKEGAARRRLGYSLERKTIVI